jgi:Protein of unknown function (DUF2975)
MNKGSTLFLKAVIGLIGLLVLGLLVIFAGVIYAGNAGVFLPLFLFMFVPAVPFYIALHQGLQLLKYIDAKEAFSEKSVRALTTIKYSAFAISALYALGMPLIIYVAQKDDAPGVVLVGLVFIFAPFVVGVFAAVLERLIRSGLDLKSENDLTV